MADSEASGVCFYTFAYVKGVKGLSSLDLWKMKQPLHGTLLTLVYPSLEFEYSGVYPKTKQTNKKPHHELKDQMRNKK